MPTQTFFNLPKKKYLAVLEASIDEFSEKDYENASIASIVTNSGIARGSFYQYFKDKEDLYSYLLDVVFAEKLKYFTKDPAADGEDVFYSNLMSLLENGLLFDYSNPRYGKLFNRAMFGNHSVREIAVKRIKEVSFSQIRQYVMYGVKNGYFRADIDVDLVAYIINIIMSDIINYINDFIFKDDVYNGTLVDNEIIKIKLKQTVSSISDILNNGLKRTDK